MARILPERLPHDVKSQAERKLYHLLPDALDDDHLVLAGVNWIHPTARGAHRDGEADFLIAHPERGLLVLEVKGGQLRYDGRTQRWVSVSRTGVPHEIKDPFDQARENFHNLLSVLANSRPTMPYQFIGGYGIVFPDGRIEADTLPPDSPRNIIIDQGELERIGSRISSLYQYWSRERKSNLGRAGLDALETLLASSWQVRAPLAAEIARESERILEVTEQQYQLLSFLGNQRRALITGCAGSGKTFLAIEKAQRLSEQGMSVLLTCFNKALAGWIRSALHPLPDNLRVQHFHELAHDLADEADLDTEWDQSNESGDEYFNQRLPMLMLDALDLLETRYDAIIVDEGQDFHEEWWIPLLSALRDPENGIFYVFYDDRQSIYTDEISTPFDAAPFLLNVNMRNTKSIHSYISEFYGPEIECWGPEGRPPTVITTEDPEAALRRQLQRLVSDEAVSPADIVILTPVREGNSVWTTGQSMGRVRLTWKQPPGERELLVSTIHSFKGLERPVVIVTELDRLRSDELRLVACSRARNELTVIERAE